MTAQVKNVYGVLERIKDEAEILCREEGLSPLLMWLLIRQQADYQLLLLQETD